MMCQIALTVSVTILKHLQQWNCMHSCVYVYVFVCAYECWVCWYGRADLCVLCINGLCFQWNFWDYLFKWHGFIFTIFFKTIRIAMENCYLTRFNDLHAGIFCRLEFADTVTKFDVLTRVELQWSCER